MAYLGAEMELASDLAVAPAWLPMSRPNSRMGLERELANGAVRILRTREHLYSAGDERSHLYRIESGAVCLYKIMPDGRRQVIDFAYAGDLIGLGCGPEHTYNAQALEPTRLKSYPVASLARMVRTDAEFGIALYEAMSRELSAAQDHLFTISQRSAAERVACFLVALSQRGKRRGLDAKTLVLPMTRADIADFLGLTIETVSRMLTKLKTAGLIKLEQTNLVRLVDISRLERLANGEEATPMAA
jgi:CRP/FNR family transcriptional regulator